MLGTILKIFKPSYALTALILFAGWQGYSLVKSIPKKLTLPLDIKHIETKKETRSPAQFEQIEAEKISTKNESSSPTVATIRNIHPGARILSWLMIYAMLCFASVPLIKKMLACESNLVNFALIVIYSGIGLSLGFIFSAFQFTWVVCVFLVISGIFSAGMITWLASELEKMRVQDSF
jgi:hypothetical protein